MEFNVYEVVDAVVRAHPDRVATVFGEQRVRAAEALARANRFGHALLDAGLRVRREREDLERWESGQAHLAVYARNCPEYMEATLGAFAARVVPFNVNYRYRAGEVAGLLDDAGADAIVFAGEFAPVLAEVLPTLAHRPSLLVQIPDPSGEALLPGARWYDDLIAGRPDDAPDVPRRPDDLYGIYTGGTTGRPKAVLWRQADAFPPLFGGRRSDGEEWASIDEVVAAASSGGIRQMAVAPFMHAAGLWPAVRAFTGGNTLIVPPVSTTLDAAAILDLIEAERINAISVVGDAMLRPLLDKYRRRPRDLGCLQRIGTGGAAASPAVRRAVVEAWPQVEIVETLGASESGAQLSHTTRAGGPFVSGSFTLLPRAGVLTEDRSALLRPEANGQTGQTGWLASRTRVPLGYLGDRAKTEATFPILDGVRHSVPGDRAMLRPDGLVDVLGRDSTVINTGGEKVFAEEVERSLLTHPAVRDAVVVGRPSERWGQEVVAIVSLLDPAVADAGLVDTVRSALAAYKAPRVVLRVDEVRRGPNAKVDLAWARQLAAESAASNPG